jgi:hypothetical protein
MKRLMISLGLAALVALAGPGAVLPAAAQPACYADYKAKRDNPLKLQYGVIALGRAACQSKQAAWPAIAERIATDGWTLLDVVSFFGPDGLEQRRKRAGIYFLRY